MVAPGKLAVWGLAATLALLIAGCDKGPAAPGQPASTEFTPQQSPVVGARDLDKELGAYVCPMHPNIVSDVEGKCPICGMDLVLSRKSGAKGLPGRAPVELTARQRQLINLRTARIGVAPARKIIRTLGIMEQDESAVFSVAAWTSGRIEKLYVDKVEMNVREGDRLYSIYSPELYSTMQEYIGLLERQSDNAQLIEATRTRLELLGLSDEQLDLLAETREAVPAIDVLSQVEGRVTQLDVQQGSYVKTGDRMYTIADLSRLRLIATIYEFELALIELGMNVVATSQALPGTEFEGTITLINHKIEQHSRAAEIRVEFNEHLHAREAEDRSKFEDALVRHLLAHMYMNVEIEVDLGEQLLVPATAVFDTGKRDYVFVEEDEGLFVPREVSLGAKAGNHYVVLKGLKAGAIVVVDGTFLLDSESQFRAAVEGEES